MNLDEVQLKCYYRFTFQRDSTDTASKMSEEMLLLVGKRSISRFSSTGLIKYDSAITTLRQQKEEFGSDVVKQKVPSLPSTKFHFSIFKNYPSEKITVTDRIFRNKYVYEEPKAPIRWLISNQKAKINGYHCQKATARTLGRWYEAWFTNEIPVSEGPYKFYGLPGLIVKISDSRNFFTFELTKLLSADSPERIVIQKVRSIHTTKKGFFQGFRNFVEDPVGVVASQGIKMSNSPQFLKMVEEEKKTKNNFIEGYSEKL